MKQKPVIYQGKSEKDLLACCPNCEGNVDWTFDVVILGTAAKKWRLGKREKCFHCGTELDWSDYREEVIL